MNNRLISRRYPLVSGTMADAAAAALSMTPLSIEREQKWLEALILNVSLTISTTGGTALGTATEVSALGLAGIVRDLNLEVNDTSPRSVVRSNGASLVELAARERCLLSPDTLLTVTNKNLSVATYTLRIPIWIAPPSVEDPGGTYFGIPLAGLKQNPILKITWGKMGDYFSVVGSTALNAEVELLLRDVKDKSPMYLASEILTESFAWVAAGKRRYELPEGGFLLSLLGQSMNNSFARGNPMNASTDEWTIYHGTEPVFNKSVVGAHVAAEEDTMQTAATAAFPVNGSLFANFMADRPDAGAFSLASVPNMNLLAGGGDKVFVEASNVGNAGNKTYFTRRVLRGTSFGGVLGL